jgi:hypothetical protein
MMEHKTKFFDFERVLRDIELKEIRAHTMNFIRDSGKKEMEYGHRKNAKSSGGKEN